MSTAPGEYAQGSTPAAAFTLDGSTFYVDTQSGGIRTVTLGASSSTLLGTTGNGKFGHFEYFNNVLYVADHSNSIYSVDTGSGTFTKLVGPTFSLGGQDGSPAFFFATLDPADHGTQPDTLYLASPATSGGEIIKYTATFTGGVPTSWTATGFISAANVSGLTGYVNYSTENITAGNPNGATVVMYADAGSVDAAGGGTSSGGGKLYSFTDTTGFGVAASGTVTTLVNSLPSEEGFRGVAFVPNQQPVLNHAGPSTLPTILENASNSSNTGELVSAVLSGLGANPITDTSASQHQGIAVTSADTSNGIWQFSLNGGSTWTNYPTVSNSAALLLASDGSTSVRFVPNLNYNGNATFTFKAWDQSRGTNGDTYDIADQVVPANTSAFSTATASAGQTVTFVNQAPSFVRGASQSVLDTAVCKP